MSMLGDSDMNSMLRDFGPLKDVFKQTILHQESIFRNQVHELHRLYSVQKSLMKDLAAVERETSNPWKANAHSFSQETRLATNSIPVLDSRASSSRGLFEGWQGNNHVQLDSRASSSRGLFEGWQGNNHVQLDSRASSSRGLFEGWQGNNYKVQPRPFGLQRLPEDNYLPNKGKVRDHLNETMDVNSLHGRNFSDPMDLSLSLSLGLANGKKEDNERSRYDKKTNTCSGIASDLEKRTEMTSDEDAKHSPFGSAAKVTYSGVKLDLQVTIKSDQGLKRKEITPNENLLTRNRQSTSRGVRYVLDLNETMLDDSSYHSEDDCIVVHHLVNSDNNDGITEVQVRSSVSQGRKECETNIIRPGSESRPQIDLSKDRGDEQMPNPACVVATQLGSEKAEEGDNVLLCSDKIGITIEAEHPDLLPSSGKSSCISDNNDSCPEPFSSNLPASDQFSGTHEISKVAETLSGEQDRRSSDSSAELDDLIQIAAESLMLISTENSVLYKESSAQTASNELENKDKEQPLCSYDSFELMTLELEESPVDDLSASSKPFEVSDGLTKDSGIKLRRGSRLKDFQKDILPSIATLSRHEIREDINILEGVLRSREYKKMRAKMDNGGDSWCKPVRSKRSSRNYAGRKT